MGRYWIKWVMVFFLGTSVAVVRADPASMGTSTSHAAKGAKSRSRKVLKVKRPARKGRSGHPQGENSGDPKIETEITAKAVTIDLQGK